MNFAVETFDISKYYGTLKANDQISIQIEAGTVHSICGENGAGKSTLMNILYGLNLPTTGTIRVFGEEVQFKTSLDAIKKRIGMVHQHFMLIQNLTVAENIVLGMETGNAFKLNRRKAIEDTKILMEKYRFFLNPHALINELSVSMQQRVEILKALYRGVDILILDEPTAVLAPQEIKDLFDSIRFLISQGKTVILISHKLKEVMEISNKISVLRLGKLVGTIRQEEATKEIITKMMVGRDIHLGVSEREEVKNISNVLKVSNLNYIKDKVFILQGLNLSVQSGEIVGIAGIDGNGQSELAQLISGTSKASEGEIFINDVRINKKNIREIRSIGMGFIPEDRHRDGLILDFSGSFNMILGNHYKQPFSKKQFLKFNEIDNYTKNQVSKYDIRLQDIHHPASSLSGGNQQKIILAREMSNNPRFIFACQPTRGLDIGAIEYIHSSLVKARNQNQGILLISYELEELIALSDRIFVMYNGKIVGEQKKGHYDLNLLGEMMIGLGSDHA